MADPAFQRDGRLDMQQLRAEHVRRDLAAERREHRAQVEALRHAGAPRPLNHPDPPGPLTANGGFQQMDAIFGHRAMLERYRQTEWRPDPDYDPAVWG